jgi:hypothetical protein
MKFASQKYCSSDGYPGGNVKKFTVVVPAIAARTERGVEMAYNFRFAYLDSEHAAPER